MHFQALMFCLRSSRLHACKRLNRCNDSNRHFLRACIANSETTNVASWLQVLPRQQHSQSALPVPSLCSRILEQADVLAEQRLTSRQLAVGGPASAATLRGNSMGNNSSASNLGSHVVHEQHIQMPSSYAVPIQTSVPAYQLVGIFRAMLGHPALPHGSRSASLEAKWGLLHLLLLHAAGEQLKYEQKLQKLLDQVLLQHAANKLAQVLVNPHVPQVNKHQAEQRYQQLYNSCSSTIEAWVSATCQQQTFQLLQPAMQGIADAMESSVAAGNHMPSADTSNSGKLMEATALQVLQSSLPAGWSLVNSLHLLGADGETFQVEQGCKYEVDMLVLDEEGIAVAVVEVKLAAANPLMSVFNDVNALLNVVDRTAGKTVTGITRSQVSGAAAASTAAVVAASVADGSSTRGSVLAKARAATVTAPFGEQTWQEVHVKVHEDVTPIYILGKQIGEADVLKGLASLVDSSALKLLARSASTAAGALAPTAQWQRQGSSSSSRGLDQQQLSDHSIQAETDAEAAGDSTQQLRLASTSSSLSSDSSLGACSSRASNRVSVNLSQDMQDAIALQIRSRMEVLQRCRIYSLSDEGQLLLDAHKPPVDH